MILTNYHTHCTFCDGKASASDMAKSAFRKGFAVLGFTSHSPLPFEAHWALKQEKVSEYIETVAALKKEYYGKMEILLGLELDFIPKIVTGFEDSIKNMHLDFLLGSVHFVTAPDGTRFTIDENGAAFFVHLKDLYGNDVKAMVKDYYRTQSALIEMKNFDILGHPDLVKKNNKNGELFDDKDRWYRNLAYECIETLKNTDIVVEINTGGLSREKTNSIYPEPFLLKKMHELGIPITINSDAHEEEHIGAFYELAVEEALKAGYKESYYLSNGTWHTNPLI